MSSLEIVCAFESKTYPLQISSMGKASQQPCSVLVTGLRGGWTRGSHSFAFQPLSAPPQRVCGLQGWTRGIPQTILQNNNNSDGNNRAASYKHHHSQMGPAPTRPQRPQWACTAPPASSLLAPGPQGGRGSLEPSSTWASVGPSVKWE